MWTTGPAGGPLKGCNSHGVVGVRNRGVAGGDVGRVVDAARAVALPPDQEVLHVLPQEFIVDDQDGIREPVGMAGVRLEARVHIVTGAVSAGQNLRSEEHTSELQSQSNLVCRLLLEKKTHIKNPSDSATPI